MQTSFVPGEQAPETATYTCYDEQGKCGGEVRLNKGERFPATQHSGSYYVRKGE